MQIFKHKSYNIYKEKQQGGKMLIVNMIKSNNYRSLFEKTGNPVFFVASKYAQHGVDLTLPPVEEEKSLNL